MNSVNLIGTVSMQPKFMNGYNQMPMTLITLCVVEGNKKTYIQCSGFGMIAEELNRLQVGARVGVSGRIGTYKSKEDDFKLAVNIDKYILLDGVQTSVLETKQYWS